MQTLDLAIVPLDAGRRAFMRVALRSPLLTRMLRRRDSRIACLASLQIALLFGLALRAPVALYFLGPLLLGVVHLAADVRYLVLRRAPPRLLLAASLVIAAAITLVQIERRLGALSTRTGDRLDLAIGALWIACSLCVALRERPPRAVAAATAVGIVAGVLLPHAHLVSIALVHGHNVLAIVLWLALFRRRHRWTAVPLVLLVACTMALLSGAYVPWTASQDGLSAFGVSAERLGAWLAPGVGPDAAVALATTFVFLQGVHYGIWVRWIPQDDLRTEGTPTFRMTARGLLQDFGPGALGGIVAAVLALLALALWSIRESVGWYLVLAKSHAWLELAFLAFFLVRGSNRWGPCAHPPPRMAGS